MPRKTKAQLKQEEAVKQVENDLREVMGTEAGRRFLWRHLGAAGIFHDCYNAESEGARRLGLALLREIMSVCPALYLKMQKEALDAEALARIEKELEGKDELED